MEEVVITVVIEILEKIIKDAAQKGIQWIVRKIVDSTTGRTQTQIIYQLDSDGDGVTDTEEVIYTIDTLIPDLDEGYCLCNDGYKIGLGYPELKLLDGATIGDYIDFDTAITGSDDGWLVDIDDDGAFDDVLVPLPDFNGDGLGDWGWLVDEDDNGLPDVSPFSPFYEIGSDEYYEIMYPDKEPNIMEKPINDYTVTEGILLIFFIAAVFGFFHKIFRPHRIGKKVV